MRVYVEREDSDKAGLPDEVLKCLRALMDSKSLTIILTSNKPFDYEIILGFHGLYLAKKKPKN